MLFKFKSQAAADVIMLQQTAEELLKIIGKPASATGIVTVAQVPGAVAALRQEIERREALGQGQAAATEAEQVVAADFLSAEPISLRQRATPFIELLEISAAAGKDVVWGV
ncbi:MAG: DUF1840 domain-containing protein [Burkholderiales bacterium]|nr:DUF1840 domain-containing protein [Burkholderiales bacterium]MBK8667151.1 DUF1840 domain-containing protein [Burkholderiales bacterium]